MKNSIHNPSKKPLLTVDFYLQCFFFGLIIIFTALSFVSGYFMMLGGFCLALIAIINSIGLTYHIFKGSYSKKIEFFRKIHAISAIMYLVAFILVFFGFDNAATENEITFLLFWGIPPFFLAAYFFITLLDWKEMKKLSS